MFLKHLKHAKKLHTSIRTKRDAKKNNVDHSTLDSIASISSLSLKRSKRKAPRRAVDPSPKQPIEIAGNMAQN